ncbi:MAG: acyl carrier protein [Ferruginibacter sp.]|nr:acyl carrier protein [Ferruginibacter sp.]
MNTDKIIADIKIFIEKNLLSSDIKIDESTDLKQAGIDSFSTVEIILFIERKFGVSIPDEKLLPENFKTISSLSKIVLEQLAQ